MSKSVTTDRVIEALRGCYDPEIPVNIVDLGLVYDVSLNEGRARVRLTLRLRDALRMIACWPR